MQRLDLEAVVRRSERLDLRIMRRSERLDLRITRRGRGRLKRY